MLRGLMAACVLVAGASGALADEVEDFYKGKQIEIVVGYAPGGGYDVYARLLAQHMPKYLPGSPTFVVKNMPGAGSLRAANYLYNQAPKDGTSFGTIAREMIVTGVLGGNPNAQFDARKFNWLGSASSFSTDSYILWVRKDAPVHRAEELRDKSKRQIVMGAAGPAASAATVPALLNSALGFNLKIISGYPDSNAVGLAVDRGEADGQMASFTVINIEKGHWLQNDSPVKPLLQFVRTTRMAVLPDVPTARELATNERSRQLIELAEAPWALGRPFLAPPGIPPARVAAMQKAFMAAQVDPAYVAEASRLKIDISPASGEDILKLMDKLASAPPDLLAELRKFQEGGAN